MNIDLENVVNTAKTAYNIGSTGYQAYQFAKPYLKGKRTSMSSNKKRKLNTGGIASTRRMEKSITDSYIRTIARKELSKGTETRVLRTYDTTGATIPSASTTNKLLTEIDEGTGADERTGTKVKVTGLFGHFRIHSSAGKDDDDIIRIVLYQYVGQNTTALDLHTDKLLTLIDPNKYSVILDKVYTMKAPIEQTAGFSRKYFTIRKSFHKGNKAGRLVTFQGVSGANTERGAIYMAICSINGTSVLRYNFNTYFKDES